MGRIAIEYLVIMRTISDGWPQHSSTPPLHHSVFSQVRLDRCACQNKPADPVAALDQYPGREQRNDGTVAVGYEPERQRSGVLEWWSVGVLEKQLEFVGEAAGEERIFHPAIPARERAGEIFFLEHLHPRIALEHPGIQLVRPARIGLAGHDAVNGGDEGGHRAWVRWSVGDCGLMTNDECQMTKEI